MAMSATIRNELRSLCALLHVVPAHEWVRTCAVFTRSSHRTLHRNWHFAADAPTRLPYAWRRDRNSLAVVYAFEFHHGMLQVDRDRIVNSVYQLAMQQAAQPDAPNVVAHR